MTLPRTALHPEIEPLLRRSGLAPLRLGGRTLLPIVQGGMGVGVSAHRLAGSVAALGGVGTISSVDLRRHHPDLMERTRGLAPGATATAAKAAHRRRQPRGAGARDRRRARARRQGRGLLAINVMRAVGEYAPSVTRALECGIDAVVVGAGLPLDLPDLAHDHPQALLVPDPVGRARRAAGGAASGSARSACPTPSSSSTRGWPAATWARRRSPTWTTRASTSRTCCRSALDFLRAAGIEQARSR